MSQVLDCPVAASGYRQVREFTAELAKPLSAEDCSIQSMPGASPTRWHLAHTTWFFETFLLRTLPGYQSPWPEFEQLFNSYYNAIGTLFPQSQRGCLSRPGLQDVRMYRIHVDEAIDTLLRENRLDREQYKILEVGLHHEQQHQELILTDIKHALACNPLLPVYRAAQDEPASESTDVAWVTGPSGLTTVGHQESAFAFDNESPCHQVFLQPFQLASRCVTNGEFLQFISDGGYDRPELWLSLGWDAVQQHRWQSPLYWYQQDGRWYQFTLGGSRPVDMTQPVCHVSYFEADAFARWAGFRLPSEFEWEATVKSQALDTADGHWSDRLVADGRLLHPKSTRPDHVFDAMFGNVWQWTSSQYTAYPGYKPATGAPGEYNGKFMCNQFVLRGGSCATPSGHLRSTYRNFFSPETRWQFTGIRLAR